MVRSLSKKASEEAVHDLGCGVGRGVEREVGKRNDTEKECGRAGSGLVALGRGRGHQDVRGKNYKQFAKQGVSFGRIGKSSKVLEDLDLFIHDEQNVSARTNSSKIHSRVVDVFLGFQESGIQKGTGLKLS